MLRRSWGAYVVCIHPTPDAWSLQMQLIDLNQFIVYLFCRKSFGDRRCLLPIAHAAFVFSLHTLELADK
jgi:hypothetical protein